MSASPANTECMVSSHPQDSKRKSDDMLDGKEEERPSKQINAASTALDKSFDLTNEAIQLQKENLGGDPLKGGDESILGDNAKGSGNDDSITKPDIESSLPLDSTSNSTEPIPAEPVELGYSYRMDQIQNHKENLLKFEFEKREIEIDLEQAKKRVDELNKAKERIKNLEIKLKNAKKDFNIENFNKAEEEVKNLGTKLSDKRYEIDDVELELSMDVESAVRIYKIDIDELSKFVVTQKEFDLVKDRLIAVVRTYNKGAFIPFVSQAEFKYYLDYAHCQEPAIQNDESDQVYVVTRAKFDKFVAIVEKLEEENKVNLVKRLGDENEVNE